MPTAVIIKQYKQSKHLKLSAKPFEGIIASVPKRASKKVIQQFIQQHHDWIVQQRLQLKQQEDSLILPNTLYFPCLEQTLPISYPKHIDTTYEKVAFLQQKTLNYAQKKLRSYIQQRIADAGYPVPTIRIAFQRSRWGSCSAKGNLNFNARLLFLPRHLVDYVIHHELAHLRHLNHSAAFWQHLDDLHPNAQAADRELDIRAQQLDPWLHIPRLQSQL